MGSNEGLYLTCLKEDMQYQPLLFTHLHRYMHSHMLTCMYIAFAQMQKRKRLSKVLAERT